ncbi:MAG: DUF2163 domain-containing protein [Rhizobiaceae bacterium]
MTDMPEALKAHLDQEITTMCHCWRLVRGDGVVFGFTDHDRSLTVDGTVFDPGSGMSPSEARETLGLTPDAIDVAGALTSDLITDEDISVGIYDRAEVETLLVNWRDPAVFMSIRKSVIGKINRIDGRFTAELESPLAGMDQPSGRYFRKACDAQLGDAKCGVNLHQAPYRASASVVSVAAPNQLETDDLAAYADGWFTNGWLSWTTGANTGQSGRVIEHKVSGASVLLTIDVQDSLAPSVGDRFDVTAGCDKRFVNCKAKFANAENFRGFPHLPGNDAAYAYAQPGLIFDGGPLVP